MMIGKNIVSSRKGDFKMPIYEFSCECGHWIEELFSSPKKSIRCPECGGNMVHVLSPTNFQLKGQCWARDSYGLKEPKKKSNKPKIEK